MMKNILLFTFLAFLLSTNCAISAPVTQANSEKISPKYTEDTSEAEFEVEVQVGGKLRDMWLNALNGEDKKFSDFKGKPLIINVWASWCGPCRAEMKSLKNLAQRYNDKQFTLIGISTDDYSKRAKAFIRRTGVKFKNYLDEDQQLEEMLGASRLPLTVFVDKDGKVLAKVRGSRQWDHPEIIDAIAKVLSVELKY